MENTGFHHIPVLFDEVMEWMDPKPDGVYADGTLGGGGHSEDLFALCADCPFRSCARKKGLYFCAACPDYPCAPLAEYQAKYVNQCNQI